MRGPDQIPIASVVAFTVFVAVGVGRYSSGTVSIILPSFKSYTVLLKHLRWFVVSPDVSLHLLPSFVPLTPFLCLSGSGSFPISLG